VLGFCGREWGEVMGSRGSSGEGAGSGEECVAGLAGVGVVFSRFKHGREEDRQTEMATKIAAQDLEISNLKASIKLFEDKDKGTAEQSGDDAPIKGRSLETREEAYVEKSTDRGIQAVSVPPVTKIPTGSGMVPTASPKFTTASVVTPYSRRKGKEKMVEPYTPKKKKLQEQIDVQMAREIEEEMVRDAQRMNQHIARDAEIATIHVEEELKIMIDGLDRSNDVIARHLYEYEQSEAELTIGMTLEEIKEKFIPVWKQIEDFVPMASKEEGERFKRKRLRLEQGSANKMKTAEEKFEREDLNQLWTLVKETLSIRQASSDKEKELWVELKRLFESDHEDQLWTHIKSLMHDPLEWKLYDTCGVHHIFTKD
nr:hypothetical protein [Tanacetum cinerariifolium]